MYTVADTGCGDAPARAGPTSWHIDLKPSHNDRQAVREPAQRTFNATIHAAAFPIRVQLGGSARNGRRLVGHNL